jgi:nucleotidyltransferase AbiEii toxin of type IV toxin-antitoxin system
VTTRPTRTTVCGRAYLDLQNLARRQKRPTDELHQTSALEGILARLVASPYADRFVLKGGVLLAAYDTRRPTRDIDLQAHDISNNAEHILETIKAIAEIDLDDGLAFDATSATAESIRDDDAYAGVRVTLTGQLSTAKLSLHVDVNVGDPVWPAPQRIFLPRLLDGHIELDGYPLPMVHAEKIVTAVQRGQANTRWRDFADVYALAGRHDVLGAELIGAMQQVGQYRQARLSPITQILDGYATNAQPRWSAWRHKQRLENQLPETFVSILDRVVAFADPALNEQVANQTWRAAGLRWSSRAT